MPKILIISSDFNLTTMMEARLLMDGYDVFIAENGLLGFQRVRELHPQLLIVDAGLPGMPGHQLIEKVKALPEFSRVPIIVVADRAGVQHLFHEMDVFHFCSKPILCAEFMEKVSSAVARAEASKASPSGQEVPECPSGRGRILLGGPHEFILKKMHDFLISLGFSVEVVMEDDVLIQRAASIRPDYVFIQLWEDRSVFNARMIDKALVENPELRTLSFYVFCIDSYASEAYDFISRDHVIPFRESRDLLISLGKLLSRKGKKGSS